MNRVNYHFMTACLILVLTGVVAHDRVQGAGAPATASELDIPYELNEYYGENIQPMYGYYYDNPQADEKILRVYRRKEDNRELYVFIGYWNNQNEEKRIVPPRYTADGWNYYWIKKDVIGEGREGLNLKKFLNEKGSRKELVYYCYVVGGKTLSSEYELRIRSMLNLLLHGRNSAMLLRVAMPVTDEWPLERAEMYGEALISEIAPLLMRNL